MIELRNVKKIYKSKKGVDTIALDDVNIKIGNSGMLFIVGKSGSGKSTLLNLLGGLDSVTSGNILINGEDISDFNDRKYDSYRNTYIGFVFQEFNVLEQYNVYENIELVLKLQGKSVLRDEIDDLLEKLDLGSLGNRKINELSGGQKQRVAIARALIKRPEIILADEPTGNLDQKSSEQIFNILKNISKEKLVIVVSHDMESAKKYADRIIEINDGKVMFDSKPSDDNKNNNFELKKSKLPFSYALKMAISSLKAKPLKLFMTIILTAMSLIFMALTVNCALFDDTMFITNTMRDNNNYFYTVYRIKYEKFGSNGSTILNNDHISEIKKIVNNNINIIYSLYDKGNYLRFEFGEKSKDFVYFNLSPIHSSFVEVSDDEIFDNIIGKIPDKSNEIVVHKYFADYVIKFGIMTTNGELYFPKDYNELVNSNKGIKLGKNEVIITGIMNDDDSLYKNARENDSFESLKLNNYFSENYALKGSVIYVKGFVDNAILEADKTTLLNYVSISNNTFRVDSSSGEIKSLNSDISIITTNGVKIINSLEKNEVVISLKSLREIDTTFDTKFNDYLKNYSGEIIYDKLLNEFIILYLKDNSSKLNLGLNIFPKDYDMYYKFENFSNIPIVIIGISIDDYNYISYKYIDEYEPATKTMIGVKVYDKNISNLKNTFNNLIFHGYPGDIDSGIYYMYTVDNSNDISNVIGYYKVLSIYILIVSLVFVLFTFLLFSNFISVSISYCKKEIGILRALGATSRDVTKIFAYESIIIGIFAYILSIIGWISICNLLNTSIFGNMYYTLNGIVLHPLVPIITFVYTIFIALLITAVSTGRITKIKPIDAILNK